MSDHVYSISEIVGTSPDTIEDAVRNALSARQQDAAQPRLVRGDRDARPHRRRRRDRPLPGHAEARVPDGGLTAQLASRARVRSRSARRFRYSTRACCAVQRELGRTRATAFQPECPTARFA